MSSPTRIVAYTRVPPGSKVLVAVGPIDARFVCQGLLCQGGSAPDIHWSDQRLRPGPAASQPLEAGQAYWVEVTLTFIGVAEASVSLTIVKPDGGTYSTPVKWAVAGGAGDVDYRVAIIRTL